MHPSRLHPAGQHRFRTCAVSSALLALSALSACGGGDVPEAATPTPAPAPAPAPVPAPPPVPVPVPVISQGLPAEVVLEEATGTSTTTTLSISATSPNGSALSYQWFRDDGSCCSTGASLEVHPFPFEVVPRVRTYRVDVSNSAGTTRSGDTVVRQRQRVWTDVALAHASSESALVDGEAQDYVAHADGRGRSHVAAAVLAAGNGAVPRLVLKGVARNAADDNWAYEQSLPLLDATSSATGLRMASTWTGHVFLTWAESSSSTQRSVVRAALYVPAADPAQPGTWQTLGTVNSTTATEQAWAPSVVLVGGGSFLLGWVQQATGSTIGDAVARQYNVPAAGAALESGWSAEEAIESVPENVSGLQLVGAYPHALAVFRRNGAAQNWHFNWRLAGAWSSTPQDLGLSGGTFAQVAAAVNGNGAGLLAAADGNGRVFVRRLDVSGASFTDSTWTYRANAYGSAPALLVGFDGRIDIFGVSVNTTSGNTSVLGHWHWTATEGWSPATVLMSNSANFAQGHGLRNPVAARDDAGNVLLAVSEGEGGSTPPQVKSLRFSSFSNAWTSPVLVGAPATAGHAQERPQLAVNGSGRATLAWGEALNGGTGVVRHARLR